MCESPEKILSQIEKKAKILLETSKKGTGNNTVDQQQQKK